MNILKKSNVADTSKKSRLSLLLERQKRDRDAREAKERKRKEEEQKEVEEEEEKDFSERLTAFAKKHGMTANRDCRFKCAEPHS